MNYICTPLIKFMKVDYTNSIYLSANLDEGLKNIALKALTKERISVEEGIYLFEHGDLGFLGSLANKIRNEKHGDYTYFNRNFHVEPTNICVFDCKFCAYSRLLKEREEGWELSADEIFSKVKEYDGNDFILRFTWKGPWTDEDTGKESETKLDFKINFERSIDGERVYLALIGKGIGLNAINPGVLIYWIGASTYATEQLHIEGYNLFYYFAATLATMFSLDLLKIHFASKLQNKLTPRTLDRVSMIVGAILIFFGLVICFQDIHV